MLVPVAACLFLPEQDLKVRYNASWALVTGASSGVGRELAFRLLGQGLNVVLVALDDDALRETARELKQLAASRSLEVLCITSLSTLSSFPFP